MEIDFLGLNSSTTHIDHQGCNNVFTDTGSVGVETSLSLSTSSSLNSYKEILNFSEKKKQLEIGGNSDKMSSCCRGSRVCSLGPYSHENCQQHALLLVPTPVFHRPSAAGFLSATPTFRNISHQLPPLLYPPSPTLFNPPQKAESSVYIDGNASTGLSPSGYTPTIAMARRATLARFLEKRLHRMNQGRTSHIMGRPVNGTNPETCDISITKSSNKKKKNNLLKRRS